MCDRRRRSLPPCVRSNGVAEGLVTSPSGLSVHASTVRGLAEDLSTVAFATSGLPEQGSSHAYEGADCSEPTFTGASAPAGAPSEVRTVPSESAISASEVAIASSALCSHSSEPCIDSVGRCIDSSGSFIDSSGSYVDPSGRCGPSSGTRGCAVTAADHPNVACARASATLDHPELAGIRMKLHDDPPVVANNEEVVPRIEGGQWIGRLEPGAHHSCPASPYL